MTTAIYLAGPVAHAPRGGAGWRETIIERYEGGEYEFLNPLSKYNVPLEALDVVADPDPADPETVGVRELVERDKGLIRDADGVLVGYSPRRSIGTPMEVMYAYAREIPTALWVRDGTDIEALSPWYRYHTDYVAGDVGACLARLHHLVHVAPEVGEA
jgi:nucleoside 2-deoxyribosyltransferase